MLGVAQIGAGQFKEARSSLEAAIKADPKYADAYNCAGPAAGGYARTAQFATASERSSWPRKACEVTEWKFPGYIDTLVVAYTEAGRLDGAVNSQKKAVELREALAKAAPNDTQAQRELAIRSTNSATCTYGRVRLAMPNSSTGKAWVARGLAEAHAEDLQSQRDLSVSFYKMAQAFERAGDLAPAREWDEKMLAIDRQLSERMPKDASARREVAHRL